MARRFTCYRRAAFNRVRLISVGERLRLAKNACSPTIPLSRVRAKFHLGLRCDLAQSRSCSDRFKT